MLSSASNPRRLHGRSMLTRTNTQLLQALADSQNESIWFEFDDRYRPVLHGFGCRMGLDADDAAEAAQAALAAFAEQYRAGRYERERGSLRGWLFAIARSRIAAVYRERDRRRNQRGSSALIQLEDDDTAQSMFDAEWRQFLLQRGFDELRSGTKTDTRTLRVFELLVVEHRSPQEVAELQGVSVAAVYVAKHRCLERLRSIVERLERDF